MRLHRSIARIGRASGPLQVEIGSAAARAAAASADVGARRWRGPPRERTCDPSATAAIFGLNDREPSIDSEGVRRGPAERFFAEIDCSFACPRGMLPAIDFMTIDGMATRSHEHTRGKWRMTPSAPGRLHVVFPRR
jgi:hypothetical protein